ncbi:MAG TPA: DUF177 domain-containing protein [Anaerolineae bacterium]|nr:DUF177 domain-containing protein [Anaerolineae bacterium]
MSNKAIHLDSLQFNVAGLLTGPKGGTRSYELYIPVSELDQLDEDFDVVAPFQGTARFLWTNNHIIVRVTGHTTIALQCSRCLAPFEQSVSVHIEEAFIPTVDMATGLLIDRDETDAAVLIDEHHILDLSEIVRQSILLALPLTPLCSPDCQGLCPHCGANLNMETCTCAVETVDPRWSALSVLLDDLDQDADHPQ